MHYIVFKTREEPHNLSTVHRLCAILHTGMHYFAYDGEAAMWCYQRLKKSRAKRRIMFVVTDGDPSGTYISKKGDDISYFTARHFRDVVAFIEAEKDVEIIGVPVKADVSRIFSRSVRIDSIEDIYRKLSPFILALLRELNEHKKPSAETAIDSRMVARRRAKAHRSPIAMPLTAQMLWRFENVHAADTGRPSSDRLKWECYARSTWNSFGPLKATPSQTFTNRSSPVVPATKVVFASCACDTAKVVPAA